VIDLTNYPELIKKITSKEHQEKVQESLKRQNERDDIETILKRLSEEPDPIFKPKLKGD